MKNKHRNHHKTVHQRIEAMLRHKLSLMLVLGVMSFGVLTFDGRFRGLVQEMYAQGWGWIGTYLHHEHPAHSHSMFGITRAARISGPNS